MFGSHFIIIYNQNMYFVRINGILPALFTAPNTRSIVMRKTVTRIIVLVRKLSFFNIEYLPSKYTG